MRREGGGADRRRAADRAASARSPSPTAPTTPCCRSATAAGRCRAIRPKARCSSPRARPGSSADALDARFARVGEVPFSSERKLMSTVHTRRRAAERVLVFTKGAPDVLLARCTHELVGEEARPLTTARRAEILQANDELAGAGAAHARRRLPLAAGGRAATATTSTSASSRTSSSPGSIGMIDPPRDEARDAVARAKARGHPPDDDHRRPPAGPPRSSPRSSASPTTGAPSPAPSSKRMPDDALDADGPGGVGLRARQPRAQAADRAGAAARRARSWR